MNTMIPVSMHVTKLISFLLKAVGFILTELYGLNRLLMC